VKGCSFGSALNLAAVCGTNKKEPDVFCSLQGHIIRKCFRKCCVTTQSNLKDDPPRRWLFEDWLSSKLHINPQFLPHRKHVPCSL